MRWLLLGLSASIAFIYAQATGSVTLALLSKGIPVIALFCWLSCAPAGRYRRWIRIGLLCSLAGDLLLEWPTDLFVFGLGAFLLAHLAYLRAYLTDCTHMAWPALLLALAVGGIMFGVLASAGLGPLLLPVACYATAIGVMLWRALARLTAPQLAVNGARLAAVGALLFVFSDSLIGLNRFVVPFESASYWIILSYWLGQWAISASALHTNEQKPRQPLITSSIETRQA